MKILLIEGTKGNIEFPNLALMKLSAWHKKKGDIVALNRMDDPDKIYVSSPFNRPITNMNVFLYDKAKIEIGGYGVNSKMLPKEIEFIRPDYDLYGIDYSMGFTSRGCIRKCPFCVVPKNEGYIRNHQHIKDFLHPNHDRVVLLDNSFVNSPKFLDNAKYIIDHKIKININQGIDVRTINLEQAKILKEIMFRSRSFKGTSLYFAWDNSNDEKQIRKGIQNLLDAGIKSRYLSSYVLVNFNSTFEEDLHRCNVLWKEYGVLPFIMSFKGKHPLQRWANRRYIKYTSWEDYDQRKTRK